MAINLALNVNTDDLKGQASKVSACVSDISKCVDTLARTLSGTKSYWQGEAADQYRSEYEGREQEMQQLMQRLEDYPTKIMQMAGVYDQASQSNEQIAGKLKPNIPLV